MNQSLKAKRTTKYFDKSALSRTIKEIWQAIACARKRKFEWLKRQPRVERG